MQPSTWVWRCEGQEVAMPTCLSSQTHLSDEVTSLQGQREAQASLLEPCPHGRKAHEWAKTTHVAHPHTERGRDDIRLGKSIILGSWLPSHTEDTHQGHVLVPSSAPVPLGLASHSKECLLTPTVHQGSVGGKTERQEAQGNGGVSKLNYTSCKSQVGSLGLTESGTQAAFSLFPVVAPGGCASSSHHVFIPPSQRKEKGGQFTHHSA